MLKNLKKAISMLLSFAVLLCSLVFTGVAHAEESIGTQEKDWLATAEIAAALRANRTTVSLDYSDDIGGYKVNYTGELTPKCFMFVTDAYADSGKGYVVSVDYKTATTNLAEAAGFVIGAKNNYGVVSGYNSVCDGVIGSNIYKTVFEPYKTSSSITTPTPYIRISSNDATTGNAYDYSGSTTNSAAWLSDLTLNDDWNTISLYVTENSIKHYVNGILIRTVTGISVDSGYIGLYAGLKDTAFRNFTVTDANTLDFAELALALRATSANTTFDYSETSGGYEIVSSGSSPKHFMFVTNEYVSADNAYMVSVDYKLASTAAAEAAGFIFGASDNTTSGVTGSDVYKTAFTPYATTSSGVITPRIRMSNNDNSSGNAYDYGTYNQAVWASDAKLNDGWNTISMYVSRNEIKHYVNGTLIWEITDVKNISGYIGLYACNPGTVFKNLTVTNVSLLEQSELALALRATADNTEFDYNEEIGGYQIVSNGSSPKHFMYMTDKYLSANKGYKVSVDYKVPSTAAAESIGFTFGATDDTDAGIASANVYKVQLLPYAVLNSVTTPRLIVSSNDSSNGAYDYTKDKVTYYNSVWASDATINDGWNNISLVVTAKGIEFYVNDILAAKNTDVKNISGFIGLYAYTNGTAFKDFEITENISADLNSFVLSNSLRGTPDNSSLVYSASNDAYVWSTTAANPKHNYFMSTEYNMTAGTEYTVSFEFKGTKTDVVPQTGVVFGAESVEGVIDTDTNGNAITTGEGLASAYRNWIYFDTSTNYNCNVFRMTKCDGTTNSVWDITSNGGSVSTGRFAFYGYKANDWNKITVKVTSAGAYYYINDRFVTRVDGAANAGGYVGIYSLEANAMYRNFVVTEGVTANDTDRTVIACVGDSITYGTKATVLHYSYPSHLQEYLGEDYEVLNFGMPGHTAVKGSAYSYIYTQKYKDSLACNPDIVVLMLGTNDAAGYWNTLGKFYENDLTEMINAYRSLPSNPKIFLCTTPFVDEIARPQAVGVNNIISTEVIPIQQRVASELGCRLISMYAHFDDKAELLADGCHPNDFGYQVMADKVYNLLFDATYGDVNGDDILDIRDLVRMKRALSDTTKDYVRANSDIDFDGAVSATDLTTFRKYLLGTIETFGGNEVEATVAQLTEEMSSIAWINQSSASKISSEAALVTAYDEDWDYSHHPYITYFNDKLYAMWSSGHDAEDNLGQRIMLASSDDGMNWSAPVPLVDTKMGTDSEMVSYALGFYTNGEKLVAYYHSFEYDVSCLQNEGTLRPEGNGTHINSDTYLLYTSDGVNWSEPISMNYNRSLTSPPQKTSDGKLIMMGGTNYIYTYDLTGLSGWIAGSMPTNITDELISNGTVKTFTEGNIYELKDGTLRTVYRTNTDYLWCAKSTNGGLSWTAPYKTNLTDDHSKAIFGTLPDGRYYYVGNPIRGGGRLPLMLSISEDGNTFDTHHILCDEPYTIQSPGLYKNGNYAYPSVCFDDEYMYIIYSKGKEVIELTKISLDDI